MDITYLFNGPHIMQIKGGNYFWWVGLGWVCVCRSEKHELEFDSFINGLGNAEGQTRGASTPGTTLPEIR